MFSENGAEGHPAEQGVCQAAQGQQGLNTAD
jgi:hypothetical protein